VGRLRADWSGYPKNVELDRMRIGRTCEFHYGYTSAERPLADQRKHGGQATIFIRCSQDDFTLRFKRPNVGCDPFRPLKRCAVGFVAQLAPAWGELVYDLFASDFNFRGYLLGPLTFPSWIRYRNARSGGLAHFDAQDASSCDGAAGGKLQRLHHFLPGTIDVPVSYRFIMFRVVGCVA